MQPNFSNRNTSSNLIKSSAAAGKKARRRLIGSVFMLLVALIILLNVTAKTKPIPVNPQIIEIKRSASDAAVASHKTASSIVASNVSSSISNTNQNSSAAVGLIASQPIASQTESTAVISTAAQTKNNNESTTEIIKLDITPKILSETTGAKLSPEDILNGKTSHSPTNIYFIQLVASKNKQNITNIKTQLDKKGVRSFIQPIKTDNGLIYRLRVGPFKSKNLADKRLKELQKTIR